MSALKMNCSWSYDSFSERESVWVIIDWSTGLNHQLALKDDLNTIDFNKWKWRSTTVSILLSHWRLSFFSPFIPLQWIPCWLLLCQKTWIAICESSLSFILSVRAAESLRLSSDRANCQVIKQQMVHCNVQLSCSC